MLEIFRLRSDEVRECVPMSQAVAAVRQGFVAFARGEFEMPIRTVLGDGQFLIMSAHHRPTRSTMVKTLSLNFASREPSIVGTVAWTDLEHTGQVVADAAAVTVLRTGAVSGVATDLLAPPGAKTCTVIGAGAQAGDQARAVLAVRPLSALTLVGRNPGRVEALAARLADEFPEVRIEVSADAEDAVEGSDIVCCATTAREPLFRTEALSPRAHVNAIGSFRPGMRELPDDLLASAAIVVVDDIAATLEESGEVIHAMAQGALGREDLVPLGDALQREQHREDGRRVVRTVFKSVGIAVQDWAVARLMAERFLP